MGITAPKDKAERDARLDLVLKTIEENPQHWDQNNWHCGTSHCFAGFAQLLSRDMPLQTDIDGEEPYVCVGGKDFHPCDDAPEWLGVTLEQASLFGGLFDPDNDIDDLRRIVTEIKATDYPSPSSRVETTR